MMCSHGPPVSSNVRQSLWCHEILLSSKLLSCVAGKHATPLPCWHRRDGPLRLCSRAVAACLSRPLLATPLLQALLWNSWVLAIIAAIVVIMIAAKDRIHATEPLANVHAASGLVPFIHPLPETSV